MINLNDNIKVKAGKPLDAKYLNGTTNLPYTSTVQALSAIPVAERSSGLFVNVSGELYWFKDGVSDIDLVKFAADGGEAVVRAVNKESFPATGNVGKMYLALNTDLMYYWDGVSATYKPAIIQYVSDNFISKAGNVGNPMTGELILYGEPTNANGAATRQFVIDRILNIQWKDDVRVATVGNITLSGLQTIDSVALADGDRVLVRNQINKTQNGIYIARAGAWERAADADSAAELNKATVVVREGTDVVSGGNRGTQWTQNATVVTLGSDIVNFSMMSSQLYANGIGIQLSGFVFSLDLDYTDARYMRMTIYDSNNDGVVNDSDKLGGELPSYYLDRGNHEGFQSSDTIGDLDIFVGDMVDLGIAEHVAEPNPHDQYLQKTSTDLSEPDATFKYALLMDIAGNTRRMLAGDLGKNLANNNITFVANRTHDLNAHILQFINGVIKADKYTFNRIASTGILDSIYIRSTDDKPVHKNNSGADKIIAYDENAVNTQKIILNLVANTNITTATVDANGVKINGKNVVVNNDGYNATVTISTTDPLDFIARFSRTGSGSLTIVGGSGMTLYSKNGSFGCAQYASIVVEKISSTEAIVYS